VAKTVAGFLNAQGGTLVIGVADDGTLLGIEPDLLSLGRSDLDGYQQKLIQVLENYLGIGALMNVRMRFDTINGMTGCIVEVDSSPQAVFLKDADKNEFYARIGNTTRSFDPQGAHEYISMHWQV
jgi:predicted HTH transcriptional regulator